MHLETANAGTFFTLSWIMYGGVHKLILETGGNKIFIWIFRYIVGL